MRRRIEVRIRSATERGGWREEETKEKGRDGDGDGQAAGGQ